MAGVFKILSWLRLITFHNNLVYQISSHHVREMKYEKLNEIRHTDNGDLLFSLLSRQVR